MKLIHYVGCTLLSSLFTMSAFAMTPQTIGWIEHVSIGPSTMIMVAKIDTGADNTSLHAEDIQIIKKDGVKYVKFSIRNKQDQILQLEKPLKRFARIKRKGAESLKRPVVEMELCLGNTLKTVPVNLANRENFKYHMLIGRSFLRQGYLVDSNSKYIAEPTCVEK